MKISFNVPPYTGKELEYIQEAVAEHKICGDGKFTKKCSTWLEEKTGTAKALLTTSCTHATEMAALLLDIKEGDEVIMPAYTFVSTADAFVLRGATAVFVDIDPKTMNIDANLIEDAITDKTKAIVPVHYAGVSCDMDAIISVAKKYNLIVVEDAAQAVDSYFILQENSPLNTTNSMHDNQTLPLGSIGHLAAFSFHETKNITAGGEGGLLVVNDEKLINRAEIIWEKGTNRAEFFRGEVNKYGWVDTGSSFLPAEINAAFLWAQLEQLDDIQSKRKQLWNTYYDSLSTFNLQHSTEKSILRLPDIPSYATNNAHIFYLVCHNLDERTKLIEFLKKNNVQAPFHYLPLHKSEYYKRLLLEWGDNSFPLMKQGEREGNLPNCENYADCLVRLPLYYNLEIEQVEYICGCIKIYYESVNI